MSVADASFDDVLCGRYYLALFPQPVWDRSRLCNRLLARQQLLDEYGRRCFFFDLQSEALFRDSLAWLLYSFFVAEIEWRRSKSHAVVSCVEFSGDVVARDDRAASPAEAVAQLQRPILLPQRERGRA